MDLNHSKRAFGVRRTGHCIVGLVLVMLVVNASFAAEGTAPVNGAAPAKAAEAKVGKAGPFDEGADARKDIAAALAAAKADGKFVLLDFGANWCPDCIMLSRLFETNAVKPFLMDNFHVVKINVGRFNVNTNISAEYENPIGKGIPAVVVLNPEGHVLASTRGGELANARTATAQEILDQLKRWRATKPNS